MSWSRRLARLRVPLGFLCGILALWLAAPTWTTLAWGLPLGVLGQGLRIWAAGHLEKSREVTQSGPYRFFRHPLYVGSSLMGVGLAVASGSLAVSALVAVYLATTITAAIRTENAFLERAFGDDYASWRAGRGARATRRFSAGRAWRNREYRSLAGVAAAAALLCLRAWLA